MQMNQEQIAGYQLSPQQSRLWQMQQRFGDSAFCAAFTILIEGDLQRDRLLAALQQVIAEHSILRASFRRAPGFALPLQVVADARAVELKEIDLSKQQLEEVEQVVAQLFQSVSPEQGAEAEAALRATLLRLETTRHLLFVSLPALCADATTAHVMARLLSQAYATPIPSEEEPLQYEQFAQWQQDLLAGEDGEAARAYWQRRHVFPLPDLPLPFARREAVMQSPKAMLRTIDREMMAQLELLASQLAIPSTAILLAVWQSLLWRLTGTSPLTVGYLADGRKYAELDDLPGLLARCLPIHAQLDGGTRFDQLAVAIAAAIREAEEWQEGFAFDSQTDDPSSEPFFSVCFEDRNFIDKFTSGSLTFSIHRVQSRSEPFNLRLSIQRTREAALAEFAFNPAFINPESVSRIADHYQAALCSALRTPNIAIDELAILGAEQIEQLLVAFNDTRTDGVDQSCFHELFAAQAARTPNHLAVENGEQQVTYAELDARADRLAHRLRASGVGPDVIVGIYIEPAVEMVTALLAVLKAGGAYLPLDPTSPRERLAFMVADAEAAVILTQTQLRESLPPTSATVLCLDEAAEEVAETTNSALPVVPPECLAYVIYTSGSTGLPKGTLITHRGLSNYLRWCVNAYDVASGDGAPLHSSIAFDLSITSLFAPLLAGKRIVLARSATTGVELLAAALRAHENFSLVKLTPAHARLLGQQLSAMEAAGRTRALVIGGEALFAQDVAFWCDSAPETLIVNEYGPTETVVGCCMYAATPVRLRVAFNDADAIPIGRPIANTQIYLLDKHLRLVPLGVAGELYIGGAGLARGYHHRPELTAERFIPHPFSNEAGERLYRTGDLARYLPDGNLEYLGRADDQVKIRGYRVELGEIEAVLAAHPAVRAVAVLARKDHSGQQRLVAYLALNEVAPAVSEWRAFLAEKLPEYMIPTTYITLADLPLSASGKVDRRALPESDEVAGRAERISGRAYVAPRTEEEEILAGIWSRVLGVAEVGIDDGYFALGGDSIRSLQVVAQAQAQGLRFTIETLFRHQTIRELAQHLKSQEVDDASPLATEAFSLLTEVDRALLPDDIEDAYPLSRLQAGMVFHREYHPDSAIYHDICTFHVKAPLKLEPLRLAMEQLVERHPALRTAFDLTSFSEPLQLVKRRAVAPLTVDDLSHLDAEQQQAAIAEWVAAEKQRGFDYAQPPLLRFHLHIRGTETFQFTLSFHHAIIDGWSDATMVTELARSYFALLRGEAPAFTTPAARYRDFIALERQALASEDVREFWRERLAGSTSPEVPRWPYQTSSEADQRGILRHDIAIPQEVSDGIKRLALAAAVPVKSVLMAAHLKVLAAISGRSDVTTFLTAVGRPETSDGERVLGLFLNSTPFRAKLNGGTWQELAQAVFAAERESLPHRRFPMVEMQKMRGGEKLSETGFYFTHYYIYQGLDEFPEFELIHYHIYEETSITLLANFSLDAFTSHLKFHVTCDRTQMGEAQLRAIGGYYANVLAAIAANPAARYEELCLLSEEELRNSLTEWGDTEAASPLAEPVHHLFAEQAARTPDAMAVECGAEQLTYEELNQRANQLANYLRAAGAGPETLVGICLERSPELVVAVLGVLKAGAAYLPLDPAHPASRLEFILRDAAAPVLLTQQRLAGRLPANSARMILLDADWPAIARQPSEPPRIESLPQQLAYAIYTSGSTGQPKGTLITHEGLSNYLDHCLRSYGLKAGQRIPVHSSIAFDLTVTSLLAPLLAGQTLLMIPDAEGITGLGETFRREESLGFVKLTPGHARLLRQQLHETEFHAVPTALILGGEQLLAEDVAFWRQRSPETLIFNEYGPTEAVVGCCLYQLPPDQTVSGALPIGRPISNARLYVLDEHGQPTPMLTTGELFIGGIGLARGYLNRAEVTAERFLPDPFSPTPGARMYRTGDLARHLPDGNLEFLGRMDDQVKLRGFRIELGEIEAVLSQHPSVSEAAVALKEVAAAERTDEEYGHRRLIAYYVNAPHAVFTVADLRDFLAHRLPEHMLPAAFVQLEALPLTANGKVNRRALPDIGFAQMGESDSFAAPRTHEEEILAGVWSRVLGLEQVGIDDDYFLLGGDSIRSIQVVALAREKGLVFTLGDLFKQRTIRALAQALKESESQSAGLPVTEAFSLIQNNDRQRLPAGIEDAYPVSRLQAGMIYHRELHPEAAIYHDVFSFHLKAPLDVELSRETVAELVQRHPALRTTFDLTGYSEPLQLVHEAGATPLSVEDISHLPPEEQERFIEACIAADKQRGFDHARLPLLRFQVHLRGAETFQFTLSFHHAIIDGWSDATMLTELALSYLARLHGTPPPFAAPQTRYRDFMALELASLHAADSRQYWLDKLAEAAPIILPQQAALNSDVPQTRGVFRETVPISEETSAGLQRLARTTATPVKSVLMAAHLRVMNLMAGRDDVLTCVTANGRPETNDGERVLGLFLNSMPLRAQLTGGTWSDLVKQTFDLEREALPHRRYPLAELQRLRGGERIAETAFYFTHYHIYNHLRRFAELELLDIQPYEETSFTMVAMFGLNPFTDRVTLQLTCDQTRISPEQARLLAGYYGQVLATMAAEPESRYEIFGLLSAEETRGLLAAGKNAGDQLATGQCLHRQFEVRAAQTPEAIAVTVESEQLSYGELNRRANQLAAHLRTLGVKPETLVAVCAERSAEMVVALLAILKTGGAYLPLDPQYPAERLAFMLSDANVLLLLTQRHLQDRLPSHNADVVYLDDDFSHLPDGDVAGTVTPENLAYVIYTSGSTGKPKGVQVTHANVSNLLAATESHFQFDARDVWTLFHSYAFDFSVWELWGALCSGGRLVVVPYLVSRSPEAFHQLLCEQGVTVLNQTPSAFRQLIAADEAAKDANALALRLVIFGGEALDPRSLQSWYARHVDAQPRLINMYGITETTVHVTYRRITGADISGEGGSVIGEPLTAWQVYVLDEQQRLLPIGVAGELYVGGAGLARGYLNRPELTAERFLPHAFSQQPGARLYRSGDLARWLPTGELEYLGRADDQVKVRGFRIELAEIEAVLREHAAVQEVVVLARSEAGGGDQRLIAYVVPCAEATLSATELRAFVLMRLPEFMAPSAFVSLEALPLTPNGKVDRRALPAPDAMRLASSQPFVAPETEVEQATAAIWSRVLGIAQIGLHDNFFELGGHSLLATQVVSRVREQFQVALPLRDLLTSPTVAGLAECIEAARWAAQTPPTAASTEGVEEFEL